MSFRKTGFVLLSLLGCVTYVMPLYAAGLANNSSKDPPCKADPDYVRFYIEPMLGFGYLAGGGPQDAIAGHFRKTQTSGLAYGLHLGYQFTNPFAVEIGLMAFPKQKYANNDVNVTVPSIFQSFNIDVDGKYTVPLDDKWDVFGRVGVAVMGYGNPLGIRTDNWVESGLGVTYGVGADYKINSHFALTAQATGTTPFIEFDDSYSSYYGLGYRQAKLPTTFFLGTGVKFTS
ncbi:MAG: OmpA-like transrane domain [Gammaproteobacteria bacterium]|jgi:hypothetical protein|nr:OmpA-like transrane domain [Gammaproteobacteria bacterium]